MAFTQSSLNYATEYSKAMANAYPYWSYFSDLYGSPNSATVQTDQWQIRSSTEHDRIWCKSSEPRPNHWYF